MGNTGACVGAATLGLGTLEGVKRPAIAVTIELTGSPLTLLDMGANIAPKPEHLLQYGHMGAIHARLALGQSDPRVGLLNIGEEPSKGTDLLKEAHKLLAGSGLRFVGNVEGGDLFASAADVVVADGFTGNVALKLMEGLATFLFGKLTRELQAHDAAWGRESLARLKKQIDYSEYGGALLLGVDGVVVIGHGRSDESAVANALALAARSLDAGVNRRIVEGLAAAARA
jgi:glycerol-3-phosphate acyltransferase PlsX